MNRHLLGMVGLAAIILVAGCTGKPDPSTSPPTAPPAATSFDADIKTVSTGEKVKIADHLVAGKYTVFEVGADW